MLRKFHFYLHIGTEKTGSTAIQIALLKNKDNLLDLGLAYLVSHDRIESRAFAAAAIGDKQKDDFLTKNNMDSAKSRQELRHQLASDLDSFISELPGHVHSIILSSEHFHSRLRYSNQVKWLYEFLLPYASGFTVICYVRPQVDLVSSSYSTMLKSYDARSLSEVVDSVCVKNNHYYNYNNFLSLWENVFGFESMVLRLFKADVMLQENVVADFFSAINNNAEFIKKINFSSERHNESLNPVGQSMLCLLNEIYNNSGQFFFGSEIEEGKAYIDKLRVGVIALFSGKGEVVSDVDFFRIENEFKESNMKVGVKWFGDEFAIVNKKNDLTSNNESYCPPLDNNHLNLLEEVFVFLEKIDFQYHKKIDHLAPVFRDIAVMRERKSLNISYRWMTLAWRIRPNGPIINKKLDEYKTRRHSFFYHLNEFLKVIFTSTK